MHVPDSEETPTPRAHCRFLTARYRDDISDVAAIVGQLKRDTEALDVIEALSVGTSFTRQRRRPNSLVSVELLQPTTLLLCISSLDNTRQYNANSQYTQHDPRAS
jgi:hypothetical protein